MTNPTVWPLDCFKWADSKEANLKAPLTELEKKGWQYADIPTASNFNWIFNKIAEDLSTIRERIDAHGGRLKTLETNRNTQAGQIKDLQVTLPDIAEDYKEMLEKTGVIETTSNNNKTASAHYSRAIEEILKVLNHSQKGEKLGLEIPIRNKYPFESRKKHEDQPGPPST